jgi:hypothetical protein
VDVTEDSLTEDTTAEASSTKPVLKAGISEYIRDKLADTDTRAVARLLAAVTLASTSCYQSEKCEWLDRFDKRVRKFKINKLI